MSKPRKIIRPAAVYEKIPLSSVTIWRKANDPNDEFPAPIILGANSTGFYEDEIIAWIESRPRGGGQRKPHLEDHYKRGAKEEPQSEATA